MSLLGDDAALVSSKCDCSRFCTSTAGTGAVLLTPGWLRCILCETPVPYGITIALAARRDLLLLTQRLVVLVTTAQPRFKLEIWWHSRLLQPVGSCITRTGRRQYDTT